MRLLLVEDDLLLAQGIVSALAKYGYTVEHCTSGRQAEMALRTETFDVLLFDLGLPDGSAVPLIAKLKRNQLMTPVLVLTAWDQIETKLDALNAGADDYVVKPFDIRELEARVRVLLRRSQSRPNEVMEFHGLTLDLASHQCRYQDQDIHLTRREFILLQEFMGHPQRVLSKEHLESVVYGWNTEIESNTVEVHIHNLRKKIDKRLIKTIHGMGYMLVDIDNDG